MKRIVLGVEVSDLHCLRAYVRFVAAVRALKSHPVPVDKLLGLIGFSALDAAAAYHGMTLIDEALANNLRLARQVSPGYAAKVARAVNENRPRLLRDLRREVARAERRRAR